MSEGPKKRPWWSRLWIWWAVPALLVLYLLSSGPAWWVSVRFGSQEPINIIYFPLDWTIENNVPVLGDAILWYWHLFATLD
jgi:hypothetical protein